MCVCVCVCICIYHVVSRGHANTYIMTLTTGFPIHLIKWLVIYIHITDVLWYQLSISYIYYNHRNIPTRYLRSPNMVVSILYLLKNECCPIELNNHHM